MRSRPVSGDCSTPREVARTGRTEDLTWWICAAYVNGPTPVEEGDRAPRDASEGAGGRHPPRRPARRTRSAGFWRCSGDVERGREMHVRARARRSERPASTRRRAGMSLGALLDRGASRRLRGGGAAFFATALEELERLNDRGFSSTVAASIALLRVPAEAISTRRDDVCELVRRGDRRGRPHQLRLSATRSRGACWREDGRLRRGGAARHVARSSSRTRPTSSSPAHERACSSRSSSLEPGRHAEAARRAADGLGAARGQGRRDRTHVGACECWSTAGSPAEIVVGGRC